MNYNEGYSKRATMEILLCEGKKFILLRITLYYILLKMSFNSVVMVPVLYLYLEIRE